MRKISNQNNQIIIEHGNRNYMINQITFVNIQKAYLRQIKANEKALKTITKQYSIEHSRKIELLLKPFIVGLFNPQIPFAILDHNNANNMDRYRELINNSPRSKFIFITIESHMLYIIFEKSNYKFMLNYLTRLNKMKVFI